MIMTLAGRTPRIGAGAYVAQSADLIGDVEIGENASIWFQCVLRGDIEPIQVGAHSNIQDGSVLHTMAGSPVRVGEWVTVGHKVILHGCVVEDHCLISMGAIVLNQARIGAGSIVAAGAVVLEGTVVPPHSLYMGFPAKLKRLLNEGDHQFIDAHTRNYLKYKERYLAELSKPAAPRD
jgi:carbonic anhydrase/acetyltransferase-like protein (isoleucine patch superfamily)